MCSVLGKYFLNALACFNIVFIVTIVLSNFMIMLVDFKFNNVHYIILISIIKILGMWAIVIYLHLDNDI